MLKEDAMRSDCVAPYVDHILHKDRFWAISIASGSVRLWDLRSCCMVLSHVMRGIFEVSSSPLEGEVTGSSWHLCCRPYAHCAQKGSGDMTLTISVGLGCLISLLTSSFRTNWCHLIPSSICRHHWSTTSIFRASVLETAQQSDPYRKIGRMHVLFNFSFVDIETRHLQIWLSRLCVAVQAIALTAVQSPGALPGLILLMVDRSPW